MNERQGRQGEEGKQIKSSHNPIFVNTSPRIAFYPSAAKLEVETV